ncbi:MAG TPA: MFS transporter [Terriglobia bacterium]|nr:MFS transporter [Terriglobia bacterium]
MARFFHGTKAPMVRADSRYPLGMLLPASASRDAARLVMARALRGVGDGFASVFLATYLRLLGFSVFQIGAIVTAMLVGSAALTLIVGLAFHRTTARRVLFLAALLMGITGAGFATLTGFWTLLFVAFIGTLNPSAGDVSVFLPTEQAILAGESVPRERTALFARYSLAGALFGALGALVSGWPEAAARRFGWDLAQAFRGGFAVYGLLAVFIAVLYRGLKHGTTRANPAARPTPLRKSRTTVMRLSMLFALDSFGGGFVVDSLLAFWLFLRFGLSLQTVGAVFFAARTLAALSQLVSPRLAARFGLINTMVFTHIPANVFLMTAAFMPTAGLAVTFLLLRMAFSSMDVPARQSYVMTVVPEEERAAAASVTNVPRSLASAISPLLAGVLLQATTFGWPLVVGGALKITYDLLLLAQFGKTDSGSPSAL